MLVRNQLLILHWIFLKEKEIEQDTIMPQAEETQELSDQDLICDLKSSLNSTSSDNHYLITSQSQQLVKKISCMLFSKPSSSPLSVPPPPASSSTTTSSQQNDNEDEDDTTTIYYKRREDFLPQQQEQQQPSKRSLNKLLGKAAVRIYPSHTPQDGMPVFKPDHNNKPKALFKRFKTLVVKHRKK